MSEFIDRIKDALRGDHDEQSGSDDVSHQRHSYARRPHIPTSGYTGAQVAKAYNVPAGDGSGVTVGIIELGGGYNASDMSTMSLNAGNVNVEGVSGGSSVSDGANGADGEVMLDVEIVAQVAPGAKINVYFTPNTDAGFLAGIVKATAECDVISISWGGPESSWSPTSFTQFSAAFSAARAKGVPVFVAAGDSGSTDGTRVNTTDYPASDPNVIGCGGTRLVLDTVSGARISEIVWNDNPANDATGGGISKQFPGRQVPDVAGNADPVTGWAVEVDGQAAVIGGTSAVAPFYAGAYAVIRGLYGKPFDFLNTCLTNPTAFYDVTVGNNGGYKAGPGRDDVTGLGVLDWTKLLAVLTSGTQVPAPGGGTPAPTPTPTPVPKPVPKPVPTGSADATFAAAAHAWLNAKAL